MWSGRSSFTSLVVGVFVVYVVHTCWVMYGIVYTRPCTGDANCIQPYLARRPKLQVSAGLGLLFCTGTRAGRGCGSPPVSRAGRRWGLPQPDLRPPSLRPRPPGGPRRRQALSAAPESVPRPVVPPAARFAAGCSVALCGRHVSSSHSSPGQSPFGSHPVASGRPPWCSRLMCVLSGRPCQANCLASLPAERVHHHPVQPRC